MNAELVARRGRLGSCDRGPGVGGRRRWGRAAAAWAGRGIGALFAVVAMAGALTAGAHPASAATVYSVTIAASSSSAAVGASVTLVATANQDVGPTPYGLSIFDTTTGTLVAHVGSGSSLSAMVSESAPTSHSFVGRIDTQGGDPIAATSAPVTVSWASSGYSASISASASTAPVGQSVTLVATANQDVGPTPYGLSIVDATTGSLIAHVGSGVSVSAAVSESTAGSHSFVGRIDTQGGAPIAASSAPLTVDWTATGGTAPVIARAAGFPVDDEAADLSSLTVAPQHVGDLMIVSAQLHSTSISVTSVTGGNSGAWTRAEQYVDTANDLTYSVWYAVATKVGSAPVTLKWSKRTSLPVELIGDSFTASGASSWREVTAGGASTSSVSSTVNWPALASGSSGAQMYWGASEEHTSGTGGTSPGFVYSLTANGNQFLVDSSLAASTTYQPVSGESPASVSTSVGAIFAALP